MDPYIHERNQTVRNVRDIMKQIGNDCQEKIALDVFGLHGVLCLLLSELDAQPGFTTHAYSFHVSRTLEFGSDGVGWNVSTAEPCQR